MSKFEESPLGLVPDHHWMVFIVNPDTRLPEKVVTKSGRAVEPTRATPVPHSRSKFLLSDLAGMAVANNSGANVCIERLDKSGLGPSPQQVRLDSLNPGDHFRLFDWGGVYQRAFSDISEHSNKVAFLQTADRHGNTHKVPYVSSVTGSAMVIPVTKENDDA